MSSIAELLKSVSAKYGVPFKLMVGILLTENPNLDLMANSEKPSGGKYLFQITNTTWAKLNGYNEKGKKVTVSSVGNLDRQSALGQITGACVLIKTASDTYGKKSFGFNATIVSYNMGPVGANAYLAAKSQKASDEVAMKAAVAALLADSIKKYGPVKGAEYKGDPNYLQKVLSKMNSTLPDMPSGESELVGAIASPYTLQGDPKLDSSQVAPIELIIPEGLDTKAWYDDPQAILGNPQLLLSSPVTFTINLKEFDSTRPLPTTQGGTDPLVVRLNCSLSEVNVSMKHIINKTNSRTGFHLTFWGMEPDTITGSGSTGVFMNRTGVTEFMSTDGSLEDNGALTTAEQAYGNNPTQLQLLKGNDTPLRVAAQDAFLELLATFRNNGIIRYRKDNYLPTTSQTIDRLQLQQSVWSEKYGGSNLSRQARTNDIMVKGNVVMRFKSNIYHGYFKSLSWVMDAEHPFHWKFDFTFQVQKTISYAYYPLQNTGGV